ncbi:MAG: hypothetical protein R6U58_06145 [Bacteroidales bacterium]
MKRIKKLLQRYSGIKTMIMLFALIMIANILLFPVFMPAGDSLRPLDLMFGSAPEVTFKMISAYGDEGRQNYLQGLLLLDFIYPVIYSLFLAFSLYRLYQNVLLSLSPVLILLSDYIENAGIIIMLLSWPEEMNVIAYTTCFFTSMKWVLAGLIIFLITAGLLRRGIHLLKTL